ncbi:MAG: NRDE family protein [Flavobacteriaceae bacterium]
MCTVTIIPKGDNDFIITSNRDEAPSRVSINPQLYNIKDTQMLFPKDEVSQGTWIGVSSKNRMLCVLNGGFVFHKRKSNYRLSRGIVVKDLLASDDIVNAIEHYDFHDIEPFTLVIADWNNKLKFMELVWDGKQKHFKTLEKEPRIWSSSTLYSETMKTERHSWFKDFKSQNKLNAQSLLKFHNTAGKGNEDYGVIMDRGFVKTTSITQVEKTGDIVTMRYDNLDQSGISTTQLRISEVVNE